MAHHSFLGNCADTRTQHSNYDVNPGAWSLVLYMPEQPSLGGIVSAMLIHKHMKAISELQIENNRLETELNNMQTVFNTVLESSTTGYFDWYLSEQQVHISESFKKMLGYRDDEIPNDIGGWERLVLKEDIRIVRGSIKAHIRSRGKLEYEVEARYVCKNGSIKNVYSRGKVVNWQGESKKRFIGIWVDVTKYKNVQADLKKTTLLLSSQNQQLQDFASISSHNLRSPAVNLQMLLQFYDDAEDDEDRKLIINKIKDTCNSLNETMDHLTTMLKIRNDVNLKRDKNRLEDCFENTKKNLNAQILKNDAIIEGIFEIKTVKYPKSYLDSIFLNLMSNSLKYSSPKRKPHIIFRSYKEEKHVILTCEDNGMGIDLKRHRRNMFGLKKTFHRNPDARGIGLFMTKNQIDTMGGEIEVSSEPDKGTTFKIRL